MLYDTKDEFIGAMKSYHTIEKKCEEWKEKYREKHYLRYEKVRSPLDYDVVGYKNGETIRQIKKGGSFNAEVVAEYQEKLDAEMEKCLDRYSDLKIKLENVNDELKRFEEPLRSILVERYIEKVSLKKVTKKYREILYLDDVGMHRYIERGLNEAYKEDCPPAD